MDQVKWMPDIGEIVMHESGKALLVQRRTRIKNQAGEVTGIRLWDAPAGTEGISYPLDECHQLFNLLEHQQFDISVNGKTVNARLIINDDESILIAVSRGDRIVHVKIPNISDQVIDAAVKLARAFDGELV